MSNWQPVPQDVLIAATTGAADIEHVDHGFIPRRLPLWTRAQHADSGIDWVSSHSAGVRLRVSTGARRVRLHLSFIRNVDAGATRPPFPVTLVAEHDEVVLDRREVEDTTLLVSLRDGTFTRIPGPRSTVTFELGGDGSERVVSIWLPHTAQTVIHAAEADALVAADPPTEPTWLHHGSSISHGLEADGPLGPWSQQASRSLGLELRNLGFAGNAMLDPFVARTIAATPAHVITLKLGINIVNADGMRARTFVPALHGFLDIIRQGHGHTPVAVITAISCPSHENVPGPTREVQPGRYAGTPREIPPGDGSLTLARTRELVSRVVTERAATDPFLWLADGLELFGPSDTAHLCDDLHPDQTGHDLIAQRFARFARDGDHPLGAAFARALAVTDVREGEGARRLPASPGPYDLAAG